ncbi:unnamed protein product [Paramecium sonneborni]|uniref:Tetratricopeptide repeat protein n=1 Tax=Paramecium sonneborni TaxID=65129 RepID=A0A8S1RMB8_9CILI|nr:unnamed protein product [Paramecium sonneborni]
MNMQQNYSLDVQCFNCAVNLDPLDADYLIDKSANQFLLFEVIILKDLNHFEEALQCIDQAIHLDSKNDLFFYYKGCVLFQKKQYQEALFEFNHAISLNPKIVLYYSWKGNYGISLQAMILIKLELFEEADSFCNQVLSSGLQDAQFYQMKGDLKQIFSYNFKKIESIQETLEVQDHAIQLDPDYHNYQHKAIILMYMGRSEESLKIQYSVIQMNPENSQSHWIDVRFIVQKKLYNFLILLLQKILKKLNIIQKKAIRVQNLIADTLYDMNRFEEALQSCNLAILNDPENSLYFYIKGMILYEMKQYREALICQNQAIQNNSQESKYYFLKGNVNFYFEQKHWRKLQKKVQIFINLKQKYYIKSSVMKNLRKRQKLQFNQIQKIYLQKGQLINQFQGLTLKGLNRFEEALDQYGYAQYINPEEPQIYFFKAATLQGRNRYRKLQKIMILQFKKIQKTLNIILRKKALLSYDFAQMIDQNNLKIYLQKGQYFLAFCFMKLDHVKEAISEIDKAIYLDPQSSILYQFKATVFDSQNQYDEALLFYDQAILNDPEELKNYYFQKFFSIEQLINQ